MKPSNTSTNMEREELKGKQTPGDAVRDGGTVYVRGASVVYTESPNKSYVEEDAMAALYAEAHNVANRTGMWPEDLVAMLASCYRASGADPDGDEDWRLAPNALRAVNDLAKSYNDACKEACSFEDKAKQLEQRVNELEEALKQAKSMMKEAMSLVDKGGKWDILHAPGTLGQGIREVDAILNKKPA